MSNNDSNTNTTTPLSSHPELVIVSYPYGSTTSGRANVIEYRVYPFRTLPSGRVVRSDGVGLMGYALVVGLLCLGWSIHWLEMYRQWYATNWTVLWDYPMVLFLVVILLLTTWESCLSLHESVTALPGLGLQLSTTTTCHPPLLARPLFSLSSSKTFIPLSDISSVVIHEGLTRLSVRYYLAIIKRNGHSIQVAFPRTRPRHAVLQEVYHGIHETLFDHYAKDHSSQ